MPTHALKIGLIGAGRIGKLHAEHLSSRIRSADPLIIADPFGEAARQCAERYGIPHATHDYHEVLANPSVEAVVICSSTDTHAQIIAEAARAGKHIFCEKPIALNLAAIDQALQAVEQGGVKLQIGFNRRFDANFRRMRRAIASGEIGRLQQFHIISRDPEPPPIEYIRRSGGIFLDMSIHDFDMLRFLTESEVEEVSAIGGVLSDPAIGEAGDVDSAIISMRLVNGAIGTISNSRRATYGYDQRIELLGSAGAINTGNNYPNSVIMSSGEGIRRDPPLHFFLERYSESFVREMEAFIDAVVHNRSTPVTGHDGRVPVLIALAAGKSLAEQRPVRLSEIEQG
ncbi:MAG: inositol 2-dehydrogenase [Ktedonobacteraceae bacterium]